MASERNALRYDAAVATLVGCLALVVSAYTAYEQHLQVRAQVWPVLELTMGNAPIQMHVANKGVGPALVRDVIVRVDGSAVHNWDELLTKLLGRGEYSYFTNSLHDRVIGAGESFDLFRPHDPTTHDDLTVGKGDGLGARLWSERGRCSIDVCYCSTLDECWMLTAGPTRSSSTTSTSRCPKPSHASFEQ